MPPPRNRQRPRFRLSNYDRELLQAVHDRRLDRDDPEVQAVLQRVEQAPAGEPWQTASVSMQPEAPPPPSQFESDLAMTRAGQAGREGVVSLLPRSYSLFDEPAAENRPSPRPDHYTVLDLGRDVLNVATSVATQPIGDNPYSPDVQDALREQGLPTDPRIQGPWGVLEAATGALPATAGALFDLATGETDPDIPDLVHNPPTWRSTAESRGAEPWLQTVGTVADLLVGPEDLVFPGGSTVLGAALGTGRLLRRGVPKALQEMVTTASGKQVPKGIKAYHGSPHSFDQFSMDKIGTGEGAQAYGHGLYFAEQEGTAKWYRDGLVGVEVKPSPGAPSSVADALKKGVPGLTGNPIDVSTLIRDAVEINGAGRQASDALRAQADTMMDAAVDQGNEFAIERAGRYGRTARDAADLIDAGHVDTFSLKGQMAEVNLRADPSEFLDWDKPLSEQGEMVRERLAELDSRRPGVTTTHPLLGSRDRRPINPTGGEIIQKIAELSEGSGDAARGRVGESVARQSFGDGRVRASELLRDAGIPGVQYLDGLSRPGGDGTRNYVMFDDKLIDIMKKYGVMLPAVAAYEGRKRQTREPGGGE